MGVPPGVPGRPDGAEGVTAPLAGTAAGEAVTDGRTAATDELVAAATGADAPSAGLADTTGAETVGRPAGAAWAPWNASSAAASSSSTATSILWSLRRSMDVMPASCCLALFLMWWDIVDIDT